MPVVSFYSYKGGVGRTFVALEVAARLARGGRRVCFWDLDLEAPALHRHAQVQEMLGPIRAGTLDLFENASSDGTVAPARIDGALESAGDLPLTFLFPAATASLDTAPDSTSTVTGDTGLTPYAERYWSIDWQEELRTNRAVNFVLSVTDHLVRRFDVVIIDARTGMTDIGFLSAKILADAVVMVFGLSDQNVDGLRRSYSTICRPVGSAKPPPVCLVANLVPDEITRASNPRMHKAFERQHRSLERFDLIPDVELPLVPARLLDDLVPSLAGGWSDESKPFLPLVSWVEAHLPAVRRANASTSGTPMSSFEDEVTELFVHAGWRVAPGSHQGVDLVLERDDDLAPRVALVECKYQRGMIGRDAVEQIDSSRSKAEEQDSRRYEAIVVSRMGFSAAAETAAERASVALATTADLARQIFDPTPVLQWIRDLAISKAGRSYVEPTASLADGEARPLHEMLDRWMANDESSLMVLVGPWGIGKTTSLLRYAVTLADRWERVSSHEQTDVRWPLFVPATRVTDSLSGSLDDVLRPSQIAGLEGVSSEVLRFLLRSGHLVLLLDGLDEMRSPPQLRELAHLATKGRAKVLLTARTDHPITDELAPFKAEVVRMQPMDRKALQQLMKLNLGPELATRLEGLLEGNPELQALVRVPAFADLLYLLDQTQSVETVRTPSDVLSRATDRWLENIGRTADRVSAINLLAELAWEMWSTDTQLLTAVRIARIWGRLPEKIGSEPGSLTELLDTCWFLERRGANSFRFARGLYRDYFLAKLLAEAVARREEVRLQMLRVTPRVTAFFAENVSAPDQMGGLSWLSKLVKERGQMSTADVKTNALLLHRALQPDAEITDAELAGADLSQVNLDGARLSRARLRSAVLIGASLKGCDLRDANLQGSNLTGAVLIDASLGGASLVGAVLAQADLTGADLTGANLAGANLTCASLTDSDTTEVVLSAEQLASVYRGRA